MLGEQRGFTLIELIVVFTVISVLAVVSIAAFVTYSNLQVLQSASSQVSSALSLAKSRTISQVKPAACSTQTLNGYEVTIPSIISNTYNLIAVCSNNLYTIQSFTLPKNVSFGSGTTSTSFYFNVITNGVTGAGTIYLTAFGNTKTVSVDPSGNIQ